MNIPFVDIHSHNKQTATNCLKVSNLIIGIDSWGVQVGTAGIHPWYIAEDGKTQWEELYEITQQENIIGIGECGLDKICDSPWDIQVNVFERQIEWAMAIKKPLIVHCVRAYQEVLEMLAKKQADIPIIFHGFNKKAELGDSLLKKGYYLSLGAYITQGKHDKLLSRIPLDRLFLETDNSTTNIVDIFSYFCAARKIGVEDLKKQLVCNLEQVFKYSI